MTLNEIAKEIHENAKAKGWWDHERSPLEIHALIHSEIAEATESVRNGEDPVFFVVEKKDLSPLDIYPNEILQASLVSTNNVVLVIEKPEGHAVELADALIRILDYTAQQGWDFDAIVKAKMEYNKTRPYRHGGKKY